MEILRLQMFRLLAPTISAILLSACAGQATLLPQSDHSFKVIGQADTPEQARKAAESEAIKTCRKTQETYNLLAERTGVLDSTEAGGTQYRIVWHFECVDRGY